MFTKPILVTRFAGDEPDHQPTCLRKGGDCDFDHAGWVALVRDHPTFPSHGWGEYSQVRATHAEAMGDADLYRAGIAAGRTVWI